MESTFDDIMEIIGNNGKYQKRFNIIFNFILVFFSTLIYMNIIYSLMIPDHWCFVSGIELTNMTMKEWKNYTIPSYRDKLGKTVYSKCKMYNITLINESVILQDDDVIDCQQGWEYDKTWYKKTVPSQEDWVCNNELNVANALAVAKIGEVIGTLIFGQLGDRFGRKIIFFVTIIIITIGQTMLTVTSHNLKLFLFFMFIGNSTTTQLLISPLIISMEISRNEDRAYITMLQRISWTIALCIMPLIMWILGDWVPFMLITTLPCAMFLFSNRYMIESPRWLARKGKIKRCIRELKKIAIVNQTNLPNDLEGRIREISANTENVYGVMSLFSSWRLAKNGLLIITGWIMSMIIYLILTLNVSNLGGNPFLNYFWQGFAEFPSYIIGKYCCDNLGRRWTNFLAFLVTLLCTIPLIFVMINNNENLSNILVIFLKFSIALSLYTIQLQGLEIFPTCIRQTGQSLGLLSSNAASILAPYVIYFGTSINKSYPYIICGLLSIIGLISVFFLPETLNATLPETLLDASEFGIDQNYLTINYKKKYERTERIEL